MQLAFSVWEVLIQNAAADTPEAAQTLLVAGEAWTRFLLLVGVTVNDLAAFTKSYQAAGSDEQRGQITQAFLQSIRFRVWDTQRQAYVDEKDFVDKNFVK
jgi:hypothetical protein